MSDIINQIADAIEAEIHEAWTESDADFIRGMEYAISIVKAVDIRTDSDTISRQAAIDGIDEYINEYKYNCIKRSTMQEARAVIEQLPSAPDSRQRGEWADNHNGTFVCDQCGYKHSKSNFCPNCGADMRGDSDG